VLASAGALVYLPAMSYASSDRAARSAGSNAAAIARSVVFNLGLWAWTAVMLLAALPWLAFPPRLMLAHSRAWMRGVQFLLATIVGLEYEARGRATAPERAAIFAFKHQSAWETLAIHLLVDGAAIVLKRELTQIPLFGWCLLHAGMIRIDRQGGARALRGLLEGGRAALARGAPIVIFPEGTRLAPGEQRDYQPGVAALYRHLDCPVVPVALNSGVFWGRRSFVKRPGRIVVEFLPPIAPGLERAAFMTVLRDRLEPATARLVAEAQRQTCAGQARAQQR
jgi:1-acyl-sn-glycerol-3-phosphate acyltransferase